MRRTSGENATLVPVDLRLFEALDRLGASLYERFGRLDVLVGNAGMLGSLTPMSHIEPAEWDAVLALNLTANWRLVRAFGAGEDAAGYNEGWVKADPKAPLVTPARLAVWWEAQARDLVLLVLRGGLLERQACNCFELRLAASRIDADDQPDEREHQRQRDQPPCDPDVHGRYRPRRAASPRPCR